MFESNHLNLNPEPVIPVELIRNVSLTLLSPHLDDDIDVVSRVRTSITFSDSHLTPLSPVFVWASVDLPTTSPLNYLLVCRNCCSWILPLLYHSVKFTKADQLSKFLSSHDIPNDHMQTRFRLIQDMYIGPTPSCPGRLQYPPTDWPVTVISRILWLSTSLRNLTILKLDEFKWHNLEHVIPSSLQNLTLGPVHGTICLQNLEQRPRLVQFTSVLTYMRDDEVRDMVCYPSLRKLRRILEAMNMGPQWAVAQVACISKARTLEGMEIVICGNPGFAARARVLARKRLDKLPHDERVVVREDECGRGWLGIVFDDYEECRVEFVGELTLGLYLILLTVF